MTNNNQNNSKDEARRYAQLLVSNKILYDYLIVKAEFKNILNSVQNLRSQGIVIKCNIDNVEPEWFAENWIRKNVICAYEDWKEGIVRTFIELLAKRCRNR